MENFPGLGRKGGGRNQSVHIRTASLCSQTPGGDARRSAFMRLRKLMASEAKCVNLLATTGTADHGMQNNIPTIFSKLLIDLLSEMGFHPSALLRGTGVELRLC
jgi:hypothetical protein